jgi:hypothetical protein
MSHLEKVLEDAAERSVVGHVSRAAERVADDLAKDALKDKAFRRKMIAILHKAVETAFERLAANGGHS